MGKIKASDRAFFLTVVLGLYVAVQLILSPLMYLGDEAYFYNIAASPLNLTSHPIWYYGPVISFLAWPITVIASWPPLLHLMSFLLAPTVALSNIIRSTLTSTLNTNPTLVTNLLTGDLQAVQLIILRLLPIALSTVSLYFVYKIAYREVGNYALLFFIPVVILSRLWAGMMWFYWDVFMMFFFVLSLYLVQSHSRFSYITTALLAVSKLHIGFLFTLPLIIRKPRLLLSLLIIPVAYLFTALLAHDILFPVKYLVGLYASITSPLPGDGSIYHVSNHWLTVMYPREFILFVVLTAPSLLLIKRYTSYVMFYLLTIGYALIAGLGLSHTTSIVYSGALVFPLVISSLVEKIRRVRHEVV